MAAAGGELYCLAPGIYETNMEDTTYFPYRWGTLVNFRSGDSYGAVIYFTTYGNMFHREYSLDSNNTKWYSDWVDPSKPDFSWKLLSVSNVTSIAKTISIDSRYKFSNFKELIIIAQINSTPRGSLTIPLSKFGDGQDCYITCAAGASPDISVVSMYVKHASDTTYICSCADTRFNYISIYGR